MELHIIVWIIAGVFAFLADAISFFTIFNHLLHYNDPLQKYIVRICIMVPVFSSASRRCFMLASSPFHPVLLI
jgi:hypothetical protein